MNTMLEIDFNEKKVFCFHNNNGPFLGRKSDAILDFLILL